MTVNANIVVSATIGGSQIYRTFQRSADHPNPYVAVSLPAGKEVTDWVNTDANTAACNLPALHGYENGKFDVYWVAAGVHKRRYGVNGTIATNALSLDGGAGDDFPASATEDIVVNPQVTINVHADGDEAVAFAIEAAFTATSETAWCNVDLQDSAPATVKAMHLPPNEAQIWWTDSIHTNPLTGNVIVSAKASCGSATNAAALTILILEDATP